MRIIHSTLAIFLVLGVFFSATNAYSQNGIIKGKIVDEANGDPLIGATVMIKDTKKGARTKFDGSYIIKNVEPGTYNLIISYVGYQKKEIAEVEVKPGGSATIDVSLSTGVIQGKEIVVKAKKVMETGAALLAERQKAKSFSDAIGAEEISRNGSSNAGDAIKKVTGATTVGGKHVFIRGLGARYASTELNGAQLPSADPDKKSVHLDLFPSALLENITTIKTATPDKPGDFTGGAVILNTKSFPDRLTFNVSSSSGYNTNSTGNNIILSPDSDTDWLGYDDGFRNLPGDVNSLIDQNLYIDNNGEITNVFNEDYELVKPEGEFIDKNTAGFFSDEPLVQQLDLYSRQFTPVMSPVTSVAPVDRNISFSYGNQNAIGDNAIGYLASFSYGRKFTAYNNGFVGLWERNTAGDTELNPVQNFEEWKGTDQVNWGGMANVAYNFLQSHEVSVNFMYNQSGENTAQQRIGTMTTSGITSERGFSSSGMRYIERNLYSLQFKGNHKFTSLSDIKLDWIGSLGTTNQDEPDFRVFAYDFEYIDSLKQNFNQVVPDPVNPEWEMDPSGGYQKPSRFFRQMTEDLNSLGANLEIPLDKMLDTETKNLKFKTGFLLTRKFRNYREDLFEYLADRNIFGDVNVNNEEYVFDPDSPNDLFDQRTGLINTGGSGFANWGMFLQMLPSNALYKGEQNINAYYGMLDFNISDDLRFIGGLRFESTDMYTQRDDIPTANLIDSLGIVISDLRDQISNETDPDAKAALEEDLSSFQQELRETRPGFEVSDLLPSVNMVYSISKEMNVRLAYGRTLARPNIREIANYASFDIIGGYILNGNANLKRTVIDNFDVRWEWFTNPGEIIAVSGFYKNFKDPIGLSIININNEVQYNNLGTAELLGAEFEVRKNVGGMFKTAFDIDNNFLNKLQMSFNLTLVQSELNIAKQELDQIRAFDSTASGTRPMMNQSPYVINFDLAYVNFDSGTDVSLNFNVFGKRLSVITVPGWPDIYEMPRPDLSFVASQRFFDNFRIRLSGKNLINYQVWKVQDYNGEQYDALRYRLGRSFSLSVSYSFN